MADQEAQAKLLYHPQKHSKARPEAQAPHRLRQPALRLPCSSTIITVAFIVVPLIIAPLLIHLPRLRHARHRKQQRAIRLLDTRVHRHIHQLLPATAKLVNQRPDLLQLQVLARGCPVLLTRRIAQRRPRRRRRTEPQRAQEQGGAEPEEEVGGARPVVATEDHLRAVESGPRSRRLDAEPGLHAWVVGDEDADHVAEREVGGPGGESGGVGGVRDEGDDGEEAFAEVLGGVGGHEEAIGGRGGVGGWVSGRGKDGVSELRAAGEGEDVDDADAADPALRDGTPEEEGSLGFRVVAVGGADVVLTEGTLHFHLFPFSIEIEVEADRGRDPQLVESSLQQLCLIGRSRRGLLSLPFRKLLLKHPMALLCKIVTSISGISPSQRIATVPDSEVLNGQFPLKLHFVGL